MSWAHFLCNLKKENGFFHFQCQRQLLGQDGHCDNELYSEGPMPWSPASTEWNGGSCFLCTRPAPALQYQDKPVRR